MPDLLTIDATLVLIVSFGVGIVVGLTGMGGGALMTPALIFLGVNPSAAVANDLVAASVNKTVGASVHWKHGQPNLRLAGYLMIGSVPFALAGGHLVQQFGGEDTEEFLLKAIGVALLFAAASYTLRILLQLKLVAKGNLARDQEMQFRAVPTVLVGAFGGLLVGITSVGSGSLIMVALLLLYPTMSALKLVGTDLVQAVPLVLAAAVGHVVTTGVDWEVLIPLIVGGSPGTYLGARMAPWIKQQVIRRGIVIVLTLTGMKLLGLAPEYVGILGAAMLLLGPLVWGYMRQISGVPAFDNNSGAWRLESRAAARAEARRVSEATSVAASFVSAANYDDPDGRPGESSMTATHPDYRLSQLDQLEAESIHIFREVAAEFEKPVLMFSGGKDSIVMMRLAEKAFYPAKIPFPVLQVDTGFDFPEVLACRDRWVSRLGVKLIVASVDDAIAAGDVVDDGKTSRNRMQIGTLLAALEAGGFTAAFGGGRRDEEKARAKERVYSHRDEFGQWDPKMQRPELWSLYNGRIHAGEHMRIFPISNWTELDIWAYIGREGIDIPEIYHSHQRRVFERDGMLLSESEFNPLRAGEVAEERTVRFRTVGDLTLTGCVESTASTIEEIIEEVAVARVTERGATRGDDRFSEAAMEDRKKEGYF